MHFAARADRILDNAPVASPEMLPIRVVASHEMLPAAARGTMPPSNRVCGKRLRALLRILLPSMEPKGHLKLDEPIRREIPSITG